MLYDYVTKWNDYSQFIKNQFTEFWEIMEYFVNNRYSDTHRSSKKLDKFSMDLWNLDVAKAVLTPGFLWVIRLICKQPYIVDMETYNKHKTEYHHYPSHEKKPIPVRLKTWHAYHMLLPSEFSFDQSFNFEIVKSNGTKPMNNGRPIFLINGKIVDDSAYKKWLEIKKPLDRFSEFTYAFRVLYQIRNNIIHAHKTFPNSRDIYLMNLANIALYDIIKTKNQLPNLD